MTQIPKFKELPYGVRKSPEKRWNYLSDLLSDKPTPETRDISITITDGEDPLQGATVEIDETTRTTGAAGGCTFSNITDGTVSVEVSKVGFETKTASITVSEDSTSFTIALTAIVYDFTSYADSEKQEELATGTVKATGTVSDGYVEMEVLTNTVEGFIGNKYFVVEDAEADGSTAYQLYTDAGTTGTGMYVTISVAE